MAEFRTVFTDDDGDGFYDDVHVVNVMEEDSSSRQHHQPYHRDRNVSSATGSSSVLSSKTKLKILGIIAGTLFGLSLIAEAIIFIICLFV